jgi:tetratricopeptide (TPR) repeat protein
VVNDQCEVVGVNSGLDGRPDIRLVTWAIELSELRAFLAEVRPFLATTGPPADALHKRGVRLMAKGLLDRAIADFSAALRKDRDFVAAYRDRGLAYSRQGKNDLALADFDAAVRLGANDALTYNDRGIVWFRKGDMPRAIADYTKAIRLRPNDSVIRGNRGLAYEELGSVDKAHADYTEAVRLNPAFDKEAPLRHTRFLRIANNTGERIRVHLRYEALTAAGQWEWAPAGELSFDIAPGAVLYLLNNGNHIQARTMRIWAESLDSANVWERARNKNTTLVETAYRARRVGTYTYTFLR